MENDRYLVHFGVPGMHWGVRRYQNYDGSLTSDGKERYKTTRDSLIKKAAEQEASYKNDDPYFGRYKTYNGVIKKGTEVERVTSSDETATSDPHKRKYVSVDPLDKANYRETWEVFYDFKEGTSPQVNVYKLKKDVKIAEGKYVVDEIIKKYGSQTSKEFLKLDLDYNVTSRIVDIADKYERRNKSDYAYSQYQRYRSKGYTNKEMKIASDVKKGRDAVTKDLKKSLFDNKNLSQKIFDEYKQRGYDAIVDAEDWFSEYANYPVILLDPAESAKLVRTYW